LFSHYLLAQAIGIPKERNDFDALTTKMPRMTFSMTVMTGCPAVGRGRVSLLSKLDAVVGRGHASLLSKLDAVVGRGHASLLSKLDAVVGRGRASLLSKLDARQCKPFRDAGHLLMYSPTQYVHMQTAADGCDGCRRLQTDVTAADGCDGCRRM
jgi:hypothetical protein